MNSQNIGVAIRMRHLNDREVNSGQEAVFRCFPDTCSIKQLKDGIFCDSYTYDQVFDGDASTEQVYANIAQDIVNGVVRGINGTIFACEIT
jgi:centromeric protein E